MNALNPHQLAWLICHPTRTAEWLKARLLDGFHVHHIDGNHHNNAPENLLLVDETDHARLHGAAPFMLARIGRVDLRQRLTSRPFRRIYQQPAGPTDRVIRWGLRMQKVSQIPPQLRTVAEQGEIDRLSRHLRKEFDRQRRHLPPPCE